MEGRSRLRRGCGARRSRIHEAADRRDAGLLRPVHELLESAWPSSECLVARGTVIDVGGRRDLSEARVEDARGRLLAHATSWCVLQPLPFEPPEPPEGLPTVVASPQATLDPYLRLVEGEVVSQSVWDEMTGLDLVRFWQKGERAPSSSCSLLGLRFSDAAEASVTLSMPASPWFCTGFSEPSTRVPSRPWQTRRSTLR
jgi:hypothetical protein